MFRKQGLDETEHEMTSVNKQAFMKGIPKQTVINSRINIQHLTCLICTNIIWKAVTCSQPNCFANYCQSCILATQIVNNEEQINIKCIKCCNKFQKTSIPIINNLLSDLLFKCYNFEGGCNQQITYDAYMKHYISCDYRSKYKLFTLFLEVQCQGCQNYYLQKNINQHKLNCTQIIISCSKCNLKLLQINFKKQHNEIKCLESQLEIKTNKMKQLQKMTQQLKNRLDSYEIIIDKIIKGQQIPLNIQFYNSFPTNFQFIQDQVKLSKSSWNNIKQKYDFLHFYITSSIKTQFPIGFQWKMQVKKLSGNLLIGICSSLSTNSVDFVINRFGEIKKKQANQNKYKLVRKGNLTFSEGDIIRFKYLAQKKILKIENETKKVQSKLENKEISQLGQNLYSFYSLDTINDVVKFL